MYNIQYALVISPTNRAGGGRTARCGHYSTRPMTRVRNPKSEREEMKGASLVRSRVLSLSSEGFQEMVGIDAGRTTHGRNGFITNAYIVARSDARFGTRALENFPHLACTLGRSCVCACAELAARS